MTLAGLITEHSKIDFARNMELAAVAYLKEEAWDLLARNSLISYGILTLGTWFFLDLWCHYPPIS